MNKLQLPLGGEFEFTKEEVNLQAVYHARVVEVPNDPKGWDTPCEGCVFEDGPAKTCQHFACCPNERIDAKNVKFLEVIGGEE